LLQSEKRWFLTELAQYLGTSPSSLQREVEALSKAGLLEQTKDGRRVYFKADTNSPVFSDLKGLLEKTAGIIPILREEINALGDRVELAFVYGSTARSPSAITKSVQVSSASEARVAFDDVRFELRGVRCGLPTIRNLQAQ
jgi:DNA-binding transcriptional ArsR family regulator